MVRRVRGEKRKKSNFIASYYSAFITTRMPTLNERYLLSRNENDAHTIRDDIHSAERDNSIYPGLAPPLPVSSNDPLARRTLTRRRNTSGVGCGVGDRGGEV